MRNIVQEDADEIMEETNFDVETDEDDDDMVGVWLLSYLKKLSKLNHLMLNMSKRIIYLVFSYYNWFQYNFNQFKTTLGIFFYFFFICKINSLIRLILS